MIAAVIDTHALIWYLYNDSRLSSRARGFIETEAHDGNQIGFSSITLVEMIYLIEKNRISSESLSIVTSSLHDPDGVFSEIPVDLSIARAMARVDVQQIPDMPDRVVAATALKLRVPVISRDGKIALSSISSIW